MKAHRRSSFIVVSSTLIALLAPANAAPITVTPFADQQALSDFVENDLLGDGISVNGVSFSGTLAATGSFINGLSAGIGIKSGLVLTTGWAANITGENLSSGITGDNDLNGYQPLTNLIPGYSTYDATVLTINFSTDGGDLYFNYVFGSDEYNEWTHSDYNDVFGFFIDGINLALVPNSNGAPVSINNVNGGSVDGNGNPLPADNPQYYVNNDLWQLPQPTPLFDFEYDGFTKVLTAYAKGLGAGNHTITLAIADAGDHILDSGVFLQAGSFSDIPHKDDDGHDPDDGGYDFTNHNVPDLGSSLLLLVISFTSLALLRRRD